MAKKAKVTAGDLFPVEIAPGEVLEARILLDVDAQCSRPRRLASGSPLAFFAGSYLVEVRRGDELLIPGVFVHAGEWTVSGRRPVVPEKIDFPQTTTLVGPRPHLSWGEVMLPVAISVEELRAINVPPTISPASTLVPLCLHRLGRKTEIDPVMYRAPDLFAPSRRDLRLSQHAERIRGLIERRTGNDYFSTAMRYGFDTRRFYEDEERALRLCPYCNGPIEPATIACNTCGLDVRDDARVEVGAIELALARRTKCRACMGPLQEGAMICPGCRNRQ